jgi:antirestriction protein ArdC
VATVKEVIAAVMIERVEARRAAIIAGDEVLPWLKCWSGPDGAPASLVSGKAYRGINVFQCGFAGYDSPYWITARQLKKEGAHMRKGEGYTPLVFWKFPTKEEKAKGRGVICRFYKVWNTDQCDGLDEHPRIVALANVVPPTPNERQEAAEKIARIYLAGGPSLSHGGTRACYSPSSDSVQMPTLESFTGSDEYYSTMFHELTHSTGHRDRLAREGVVNPIRFASHGYSEEELVAEMGATMLRSAAGITSTRVEENSAAYLDHWLRAIKGDPDLLVKAGGLAQKAADLIQGIKWGEDAKAA